VAASRAQDAAHRRALLPEYRVVLFEHGVVIAGRFGVAEWFHLLDIISRVSPPWMIAMVSAMKSATGIACESVSPSGVSNALLRNHRHGVDEAFMSFTGFSLRLEPADFVGDVEALWMC
jgi:hypothetical protein